LGPAFASALVPTASIPVIRRLIQSAHHSDYYSLVPSPKMEGLELTWSKRHDIVDGWRLGTAFQQHPRLVEGIK
jgi:hypothetical protein